MKGVFNDINIRGVLLSFFFLYRACVADKILNGFYLEIVFELNGIVITIMLSGFCCTFFSKLMNMFVFYLMINKKKINL